jgi:hypothetical protein
MVGTVIFKDFETGSYENMRVTLYNGHAYKDIDRQDNFSSCIVSPEKRRAVYDVITSADAPRLNMNALFELCRRAREFFYDNDWVTIADFAINGSDISLRQRSSQSGIFAPVDVRGLFDYKTNRIYKLCMESDESYLGLSIRCAVVNYCLKKLFDIEDDVFAISGKGVYIDASLFTGCRRSMDFLCIAKDVARLIKIGKRNIKIKSPAPCADIADSNYKDMNSHMRLIELWRKTKVQALFEVYQKHKDTHMCPSQLGLNIIEDISINKVSEEFRTLLTEYLEDYEFCFEAKSHINYISVEDALCILSDIEETDKIAKRAAALSANMKLRKRLPCADYYDSHGRAYNV